MASLKEVKGRINSIHGTLKITSAMKMVASSKLHKAQEAIENMLPYERRLHRMLSNFLGAELSVESPFAVKREVKKVAVVGGGDTACEEATYLASLCRKVYLIVRKPHLRASKAMQQRVFNTPNIEVLFEHNTAEVLGDDSGVTGALLRRNDGSERKIDIAGFFLAIGHHPNTELFAEQLALDAEGYIKVEPGTSKTSVEGVFAAGDVKDPHYRQAITAAASGCVAALDCERFLLQ